MDTASPICSARGAWWRTKTKWHPEDARRRYLTRLVNRWRERWIASKVLPYALGCFMSSSRNARNEVTRDPLLDFRGAFFHHGNEEWPDDHLGAYLAFCGTQDEGGIELCPGMASISRSGDGAVNVGMLTFDTYCDTFCTLVKSQADAQS